MLKAAFSIGAWTLVSRVTGFLRDALMLALLGASPLFDAFIVAFKLPNFFRRLSAEGAFSAAFIPQFSALLSQEGPENALRFARDAMAAMSLILISLVGLVEFMTPSVMWAIAPGFDGERLALATAFTRITFPYILFMSLAALVAGVLNSFGRFMAAAAAPVILNIAMILALIFVPFLSTSAPHAQNAPVLDATAGVWLSWAVLGAGIAQYAWVSASLRRAEPRWHFPWRTVLAFLQRPHVSPALRNLFRTMAPGVVGAGVFQINVLIDIVMASFLPVGSLTFLHAADRLNQLPLSVIGVAISTAYLPLLSRQIAAGDTTTARQTLGQALSFGLILSLPACCALMMLAPDLMRILFVRGAFTVQDSVASAEALRAFALGLPAYISVKILTTRFFAQKDTLTPVILGTLTVVLNFVLNLLLIPWLGPTGIALATALASWGNAAGLWGLLVRNQACSLDKAFFRMVGRALGCTLLMISGLQLSRPWLAPMLEHFHEMHRFLGLGLWVSIGLILYLSLAWGALRLGRRG